MKKNRKHSFKLTLSIAVFVFCVIFVVIVVAFGLVNLLAYTGIAINIDENTDPITFFILMGAVSLILGIAASFFAGKIPLKPIYHVTEQINRLGSGDFKARLSLGKTLTSFPSVAKAQDSFNKMAEQLENTELLREDFVNNFSHEFKTPIVSIAGFAKLLKKGNLTEEQKKEYLDIIEEESLRLSAMATNVLNLTKVENQSILTDVCSFNLSEQIRNCILLLEPEWVKKDVEFDLKFDEHDIKANEELLKQVWINLIDNAIKYSDGYIGIYIAPQKHGIAVTVANSGAEIPADKRERIFDKFYQADTSHATPGNGIGLALAKKVVTLHKGNITVDCRDSMTYFTVTIPQK